MSRCSDQEFLYSVDQVERVLTASIERLRDFGLRTSSSDRLSRYRSVLHRYGAVPPSELVAEERDRLANALCEAMVVCDIAILPDVYLSDAKHKVRYLSQGQEFEDPTAYDRARDTALELHVAARAFAFSEGILLPGRRGDVCVWTNNRFHPVEVKRASSPKGIEQLLRTARDQLRLRPLNDCLGAILIDVGSAIRFREGFILARDEEAFIARARMQGTAFLRRFVRPACRLIEDWGDGVSSLILRFMAFGWIGGLAQGCVRRVITTHLIELPSGAAEQFEVGHRIMQALESGDPIDGSADDLDRSIRWFSLDDRPDTWPRGQLIKP